jgi:hypothetical protein
MPRGRKPGSKNKVKAIEATMRKRRYKRSAKLIKKWVKEDDDFTKLSHSLKEIDLKKDVPIAEIQRQAQQRLNSLIMDLLSGCLEYLKFVKIYEHDKFGCSPEEA